MVIIRGPAWNMALQVESVKYRLMKAWAAFNGMPLIQHPGGLSTLERLRRRPGQGR